MSIDASFTVYAYLAAGISNTVLRRTMGGDYERPFSTPPLSAVLSPIGFIVASLLVYWSGWSTISVLLVVVSAGLPLLLFSAYGRRALGIGSIPQ